MRTKRTVALVALLAVAVVTAGCLPHHVPLLRKKTEELEQARERCMHAYYNLCSAHVKKLVDDEALKKGTTLYNEAKAIVEKGEEILAAAARRDDQELAEPGVRAAIDKAIAEVNQKAGEIEALIPG